MEIVEGGIEVTVVEDFANHRLLRDLVRAGFDVDSFTPISGTLSDVFMRLTGSRPDGAEET